MAGSTYTLLQPNGSDVDGKEFSPTIVRSSFSRPWKSVLLVLGTTLIISLSVNALFIYQRFFEPWDRHDLDFTSKFARLRRDVATDMVFTGGFDNPNRTIQDAAWNQPDMIAENGFVAIDEDYAMAMGLPHSQRWPWDKSKGTYILTSAHEMHCAHVLRDSVNNDHDDVPEESRTWHYEHVLHCLNVLRESITCRADDTPMYTGHVHGNVHAKIAKAGRGQVKMCRDWHALQEWSRARSACYRFIHYGEVGFPDLERYKFCPDGSRPWEELDSA